MTKIQETFHQRLVGSKSGEASEVEVEEYVEENPTGNERHAEL